MLENEFKSIHIVVKCSLNCKISFLLNEKSHNLHNLKFVLPKIVKLHSFEQMMNLDVYLNSD